MIEHDAADSSATVAEASLVVAEHRSGGVDLEVSAESVVVGNG